VVHESLIPAPSKSSWFHGDPTDTRGTYKELLAKRGHLPRRKTPEYGETVENGFEYLYL
jgi:hypothetical protein